MGQTLAEVLRDQHTWRYGHHCDCGAEMNSPATYSAHLADVVTAWLTANSGDTLATIRAHLPRDRYDDGAPVGTYCSCGGWEGDYFADGEAGPFDEHLAAMVEAEAAAEATQKGSEAARNGPRSDLQSAGVNLGDGDDERRRAVLFNDISYVPMHEWLNMADRQAMADHLWAQGWRRDVRPEDVTE